VSQLLLGGATARILLKVGDEYCKPYYTKTVVGSNLVLGSRGWVGGGATQAGLNGSGRFMLPEVLLLLRLRTRGNA
jgi:hypothetical protein